VIEEYGFVWHMVGTPNYLSDVAKCMKEHPKIKFMIDHLCMEQGGDVYDEWAQNMDLIAALPNVCVNLGGIEIWEVEDPQPYLIQALKIFGYDRCCIGSNWYLSVASSYDYSDTLWEVKKAMETLGASKEEQDKVWRHTATRIYG